MSLRCFFFGHSWVLGRVTDPQVLRVLKEHAVKWDSPHNRQCLRCGREERHADELEAHLGRILNMRRGLGM